MVFHPHSTTIRELNQQAIANDEDCQKVICEMKIVEEFLADFGFLSFSRDYVSCDKYIFSMQKLSTATELTVGSMISCCECGCIADAYSLLRKYRDDLFFYLYVVVYNANNMLDNKTPTVVEMESNIMRWIKNDLRDLYIGDVLKAISRSPQTKDSVKKYKLKKYFDTIKVKLNDYVHSNGISFYNQNVNAYKEKELHNQLAMLLKDMRFITVTFLFLLTLTSPHYIMSTDYVDYLEYNMTPPNGSQYWVAPFVNDFFKKNLDLIDETCMKYLQENTPMELG